MRDAEPGDIPAIAALRESVGWGVQNWALRAVLEPPEARCVVVVDGADGVVGVGSGISYGALGFVGNMVVAEGHRRRGIGAAVLAEVIVFLESRGCSRLELFATEDGRPLYARFGFELTRPSAVVHIARTVPLAGTEIVPIDECGADGVPDVAAYDAPRFGGDRRRLLELMVDDAQRPLLVARRDGVIVAYGWLRPDGSRIGPLVADTPDLAATMVAESFRRAPGADELALNMPAANGDGAAWARELGLAVEPWDGRMARGPSIPRRDETIYANAVGALG